MARRRPVETAASARSDEELSSPQTTEQTSRLVVLPPDWLPLALLIGDAVIVGASVLTAYWYYVNLDPLRRAAGAALPLGPYVAAIPVAIAIYLFSLAINHQYQSWRGRTLMDLVLGLYSGVGLAAVGLLGPLLAAFIHVASELAFILNSARLLPPRVGHGDDTFTEQLPHDIFT